MDGRLLVAACVVSLAGTATVQKHVFETDDAVIVEADDLEDSERAQRELPQGLLRFQTVVPPGWPGLPAGVTNDCDTRDGRSGTCVVRTACFWSRSQPPDDANLERQLGSCLVVGSRDVSGSRRLVRGVCCPGLFAATTEMVDTTSRPSTTTSRPSTTTSRPGSGVAAGGMTHWWQTTGAATGSTSTTTSRPGTTTSRPGSGVAAGGMTHWWQTTGAATGSTSTTAATSTARPATTSTARWPPQAPTFPPIITHPWMATSTAQPQQTTGWWQTSSRPTSATSTTVTSRPATTGWWQTSSHPTSATGTTVTSRPATTGWWQTSSHPTFATGITVTSRPATTAWWQTTAKSTTASTAASTTASTSAPENEDKTEEDFSACGTRNQDSDRIVNGKEAIPGEFPWMAAIFKGRRQFCGGSLIDQTHILTAAHCVAHMTPYDVRRLVVRLGDHDISTSDEADHEEYHVSRVIRHKGFSDQTLYTDIALLTLKKAVVYKDNIRPVCLASGSEKYTNEPVIVTGWGTLSEAGRQPSRLQKVTLKVWKNEKCSTSYGSSAPGGIISSMLCAASEGKDSCSGDSGGPLMHVEDVVYQVGVVSWGIGCAKPQYPGVYTRVTSLRDWVDRNRKAY